mgnify:CR=1 FL=1
MSLSPYPRISIFLASLRGGGAERVMLNVSSGLATKGYPIDLVLVEAVGDYLTEVPPNIRVIDLHSNRSVRSLPRLIRYLHRDQPPILISSLPHISLVALAAKMLARSNTRIIVVEHNTLSQSVRNSVSLKGRILPFLMRYCYRQSERIVAVSKGVANDLSTLIKHPINTIDVIYNPVVTPDILEHSYVPLAHPWFIEGEPPVILGIGRLTRAKGFSLLIRAFAKARNNQSARLMILGEGHERPSLEHLIRELDLEHDVALPGFVPNPYNFLKASRLFVLSSFWEGLPTVLIEALACGTPVISTDCPSGPREILQDGRWGTLVPVDNESALSAAIIESLQAPTPSIPVEAWTPFTLDNSVSQYLQLINKVHT